MGYRYDPLREHLASQAESVVVMTYTEIETLLGGDAIPDIKR